MINIKRIILPEIIFLVMAVVLLAPTPALTRVKTGIDVLAREHPEMVRGKKLALLTAKTAIDGSLSHTIDRLAKAAVVKLILTGDNFFRETIPGEVAGEAYDALTNARVVEVLDPLKRPKVDIFGDTELLIIDFQDLGIRYFKYLTLMAQFLDLAREASIPVLVLDRPNPINARTVAGPVLEVGLRSRFGVYPIPLLHGMTIGELALYFNKVYGLGASLTVIGMEGYDRDMNWHETGLHWVPPSDHVPEPDTPAFYAATGFIGEIGVFSTGVGTTRPFHYVLAPWIDGEMLAQRLERHRLPGVRFIPASEKPYYGLFAQRKATGIELVITDRATFDPFLAGMAILKSLYELYPDRIPLNNPAAAEAVDTLLGSQKIRQSIISSRPLMETWSSLQADIATFNQKRREFMIYPE
ncbi:MAG: Protein YzbB [Candidatus Rifleibacterium amylolyticum]|nr:MAG: Protein YzbB [Candidatus Rifleibacterium amylolyticum]